VKPTTSRWKRGLDVLLGLPALALAAPVLLVVGLGLRRSTGESALIRQHRAGLGGRQFELLKLRTMTEERGADGQLLPDDERLTRLGRLVRSLSIDELPQLVNVLRGEMSLVGPRPLPARYEQLYTPRERSRARVRPGITGWAQIHGRQRIPFSQRLEHDAWYVEHWSSMLDLKIMLLTIPRLVRRSDVMVGQEIEEVDDRGFADLWREHQLADARAEPEH